MSRDNLCPPHDKYSVKSWGFIIGPVEYEVEQVFCRHCGDLLEQKPTGKERSRN